MEDVLNTADLMKRFKVCRDTIRRWQRDGHLPEPFREGGKKFWTREQVEDVGKRGNER